MLTGVPPNRERFLCGIAERVAPDRVQALYLFAPMRQGAVETGVAVLAVDALVVGEGASGRVDDAAGEGASGREDGVEGASAVEATDGVAVAEAEVVTGSATNADADIVTGPHSSPSTPPLPHSPPRPVVLTAQYRHTLKGPDRGKWTLEILEQADAPLVTVEKVIQGVQHRLDESVQPERLGAEALRAALAEGLWTPPQR